MRRHLPSALALLALAALPLVAERLRAPVERCEMNGVALDPAFRVRVTEPHGAAHGFCGVSCAEAWIARSGAEVAAVRVTDAVTGAEVDGTEAWFVRTVRNVSDGAPDAIRVFARKDDALRHASAHGGHVLVGAERPFRGAGHAEN
jgi:hypothetical protein